MQTTAAIPVNVVNPREAAHIAGEDYQTTQASSLYQWHGLNSGHGYEAYFSDGEGWQTPEQAQADVLYCLCTFDGDEHETAMQALTSWRFFSLEVLNNCDREISEPFDFSDLEAASGEELPLSPSEIRAELEQLAEAGNATPDDYLRLWQAWQAAKDSVPVSYYPVIVDRLNNLLSSVVPMAGEAAEIAALARATIRAMNSTDLVLDELKATYGQRFSY